MRIANILVKGEGANAYDKPLWTLSVEYDGDIYTVDPLGDVDIIGEANTIDKAMDFVREYFSLPCYTEV